MNDALLMRMLYPSAYRNKKLQPLPHRKLLALGVIGKLLSIDQFHHEKRPTRFCRSGVQHPGDVGMVHHGQRLPLGLEARHHGVRIHTVFEDLERACRCTGSICSATYTDAKPPSPIFSSNRYRPTMVPAPCTFTSCASRERYH